MGWGCKGGATSCGGGGRRGGLLPRGRGYLLQGVLHGGGKGGACVCGGGGAPGPDGCSLLPWQVGNSHPCAKQPADA